ESRLTKCSRLALAAVTAGADRPDLPRRRAAITSGRQRRTAGGAAPGMGRPWGPWWGGWGRGGVRRGRGEAPRGGTGGRRGAAVWGGCGLGGAMRGSAVWVGG